MIEVVHTIADVRQRVAAARAAGWRIGFVPTMGALHEGHASLIRRAVAAGEYTVVSIFVNPLQFGPGEDFEQYPRTLDADREVAASCGAHLIFAPSQSEMYPREQLTFVEVERLTEGLCGASRPGHFRGVATVVAKLFNIVAPDTAYFGQKDAQQAVVIRRMTEDLCMPVRIEVCPIVREPDGLALSSRNAYLDPRERQAATVLYRALRAAEAAVLEGERRAETVRQRMLEVLASEPLARVDYAEVVDAATLQPLETLRGQVLLAVAAFVGKARLIDNIVVEVDS